MNRVFRLIVTVVAAGLLVAAFSLPFMEAKFKPKFPPWIEKGLGLATSLRGAAGDVTRTLGSILTGDTTRPTDRGKKWSARRRFKEWVRKEMGIPEGERKLFGIISNLFQRGEYLLGGAILLFSVVFPGLKLLLSLLVNFPGRVLPFGVRRGIAKVLVWTGKWSMADVFIAAMMIVFFKADAIHFEFISRQGLYFFFASAILSSLVVWWTEREYEPDREEVDRGLIELEATAVGLAASTQGQMAAEAIRRQADRIKEAMGNGQ